MAELYLKCGHGIVGTDGENAQMCPICFCTEMVEMPDLSRRVAVCDSCGKESPSNGRLPFFQHKPGEEKDRYYCGCRGWD